LPIFTVDQQAVQRQVAGEILSVRGKRSGEQKDGKAAKHAGILGTAEKAIP
jgi:hypothetical protein